MEVHSVNTDNIVTCDTKLLNDNRFILTVTLFVSAMMTLYTIRPDLFQLKGSSENITTSDNSKLKYILLWTDKDWYPFVDYKMEQQAFLDYKCQETNCYVTDNRRYFGGDLKQFDAVLFNGRIIDKNDLPLQRYPHQKYVFTNLESADNYPVCNSVYDHFFNWTATYRLDSDIQYLYMLIENKSGTIVGPRDNMEWIKEMTDVNDSFAKSLETKKKAAAWFVSNCNSKSNREYFVMILQRELRNYKLEIDIYGGCGPFKCPRSDNNKCLNMLRDKYYFYLALENSITEDYITEKVLHALNHNVVPIVYGGANYSRFLPPGSYLDARAQTPDKLAAIMNSLINSPDIYRQYFKWKNYYRYSEFGNIQGVCTFCKMLNDEEVFRRRTVYENFRGWWNSNFENMCANS